MERGAGEELRLHAVPRGRKQVRGRVATELPYVGDQTRSTAPHSEGNRGGKRPTRNITASLAVGPCSTFHALLGGPIPIQAVPGEKTDQLLSYLGYATMA